MSKLQKFDLLKRTEIPTNRLKNETVKEKEPNEKSKISNKSTLVPNTRTTKIPSTKPIIPLKTVKPNPTKVVPKKLIAKPTLRTVPIRAKPVVPTPKISKNNVMNKIHNVTVSSPPSQRKEEPNLNRNRTLTRTLEPHEILILNKPADTHFGQAVDKDSLDSELDSEISELKPIPIVKDAVAFEIKFEDKKSKKEEPEDDEYESDFESYESDFETGSSTPEEEEEEDEQTPTESESESESTVSSPELTPPLNKDEERKLDSGNYELRIQREKQQMDSIDEGEINSDNRNDSGLGYSALLKNGSCLESNSKVNTDTDVEESLREDKQIIRKNTRGYQLMKKITLDIMSFSIFELKPIPYDVYMKMYGNSNTSQNSTQTNDDLMNQDTQTDFLTTNTIWTQFPPSFTQMGLSESMRILYQQERIGVGDGDFIETSVLTDLEKSLRDLKTREIGTSNQNLIIDFERMNLFLQKSSVTISNILDKKLKIRNLNKTEIPISHGYFSLNTKQSILEQSKITKIYSNQNIPNLILTVHEENSKDFDNLICVWRITDPKSPFKMLSCWSSISCIEIHSDHPDVIIAGMIDGSLAIWDLKESSSWHFKDNSFRIPSQIIGHDLKDENLNDLGKIVSVKSLKNHHQSNFISDYHPSQICSLHEEGLITIWTMLDTKNLNFDVDQLNISPWSRIKLVRSTSIDLRQKLNSVKRRKSQFEKTRSYFENDIFSDDVLKELNGNSDVEKGSNQRDVRMTDFEINSEGFYIGTNRNYIFFLPKSMKICNSRKIIVDETNFLHSISLRLFLNQKVLAVGLSDGSIKLCFCSIEKPEQLQEPTQSTSTQSVKSPEYEIENNLSAKSCAIQNIIKSERKSLKNSDLIQNKEVHLHGTQLSHLTITKLVNQQVIFGGESLNRNFTKTIQILRDDNSLFALIGDQLKLFNVLKNSEIDFDAKLNDLKDIGLSDNGYGNKFLILLASDEVQIHRLH